MGTRRDERMTGPGHRRVPLSGRLLGLRSPMRFLVAILVAQSLVLGGEAAAAGPEDVGPWIRAAGVRPEAASRVHAWSEDGAHASDAFRAGYPRWIQARIADAVSHSLPGAAVACASEVHVRFIEPGSYGRSDPDRAFERSTFEVVSLHCLDRGDAEQAMAVYNSASFREAVMPGLESYWRKGDDICITTGAVAGIVERTQTCSATRTFAAPGVRAFHAQLVESVDAPDTQGVYLRESVVAFVDRQDGGVAVLRVVTTRGKDMGMVQRGLLGTVAANAQDRIAAALEERLQ